MRTLAAFACACAALLASTAFAGDPPPVPLRVVTLNILNGIGSTLSNNHQQTGDFLTTNDIDGPGPNFGLNPDVVLLQECRSNTNLLDFRDAFLPNYQYVRVNSVDAGGNFNAAFIRPDIIIRDTDAVGLSGPRPALRLSLSVPGALRVVTLYNCHLKAFTDSDSQQTRTNESNNLGVQVYNDLLTGVDLDDNGSRETVSDVAVFGDLNSNGNFDGTLDGIFTHHILQVPTGVLNLPVQNLLAGTTVTYPSFSSRLDYGCLDNNLASYFDADMNGSYSQTEINSMGFVYYSGDDNGQRSNGDNNATSFASDHRPVVFTMFLDGDPAVGFDPKDLNLDNLVNTEDLALWEEQFFNSSGPAKDTDQDFDVDLDDRDLIYDCLRENEIADVTS